MEVFWLEEAISDLEEIVAYIAERNPTAAPKVAAALHDAAVRLRAPIRTPDDKVASRAPGSS